MNKGIIVAILAAAAASLGAGAGAAQSPKVSVKTDAVAKKSPNRVNVTYSKNGAKKAAAVAGAASAPAALAGKAAEDNGAWSPNGPDLKSSAALVLDAIDGTTLYAKNTTHISAIASITKLMSAMVVLDAELPLEESIRIERADIDTLKHTVASTLGHPALSSASSTYPVLSATSPH